MNNNNRLIGREFDRELTKVEILEDLLCREFSTDKINRIPTKYLRRDEYRYDVPMADDVTTVDSDSINRLTLINRKFAMFGYNFDIMVGFNEGNDTVVYSLD